MGAKRKMGYCFLVSSLPSLGSNERKNSCPWHTYMTFRSISQLQDIDVHLKHWSFFESPYYLQQKPKYPFHCIVPKPSVLNYLLDPVPGIPNKSLSNFFLLFSKVWAIPQVWYLIAETHIFPVLLNLPS